MTQAVYSTRALIVSTNTGTAFQYVVPNGFVFVITSMTACKSAAATPVDILYSVLGSGAVPDATVWFASFIGTTKIESSVWNGRVVCEQGDTIQVQRSTVAGSYQSTVSGYLLTIAP